MQQRRPYSAMVKREEKRPQSGLSERPVSQVSVEKELNQGRYALELNQVEGAVEYFSHALGRAVQQMPSVQFLELLGQVVFMLNAKIQQQLQNRELLAAEKLTLKLLQWVQVHRGNEEFSIYVKCTPQLQALILNSYAKLLMKQAKHDECLTVLEKTLTLLSASELDPEMQELVGYTYLNYSTCLLYQQNYSVAIQVAQNAVTYLQQSLIQALQNGIETNQVAQNITDAYVNLAVAKEKTKAFQEAHFNYYSAMINAQTYLPEEKQQEVKKIYDKYLTRQAGYLQVLQTNKKQKVNSASKAQPFIELVRMSSDGNSGNGNMQNAFLKRQKSQLKMRREASKREQRSLNKFKPYIDQFQVPLVSQSSKKSNPQAQSQKTFHPNLLQKSKSTLNAQPKEKVDLGSTVKSFQIKKSQVMNNNFLKETNGFLQNSNLIQSTFNQSYLNHPSPVIRFMEGILQNKRAAQEHDLVQLEDFQDIRLSIRGQMQSSLMVGQLTIYLFRLKHLLYLRYYAFEQSVIDQFSAAPKKYDFKLFAHSFNVSDVANDILNTSQLQPDADRRYATFLNAFILEVCRYLFVNHSHQALSVSHALGQFENKNPQQISFFLSATDQYISIQQKNEYESLVFIAQDPQLQDKEEEIFPLVYKAQNSNSQLNMQLQQEEDEGDLQPLIQPSQQKEESSPEKDPELESAATLIQRKFRMKMKEKKKPIQDETVEVSEIVEVAESQEKTASQFRDEPKTSKTSKPRLEKPDSSIRKPTQEKFTIIVGSEDQPQKQEFEVYAGQPQVKQSRSSEQEEVAQNQDPELENAARLIQNKFRLRKMQKK